MLEIARGACHGDPVVDLTALLADLRAEGDELDALLSPLPAADWALPTPAEGWTVAHQVAHLAWTDDCALLSVTDPDGFRAKVAEVFANHPTPLRWVDEGAEEGPRTPPAELLARWRTGRTAVLDSFAAAPDGVRHPWFATPMSTASMATARLMETWAHSTDVFDALGTSRKPTGRLKHVAYLGVRTRDFAYGVRNLTPPAEPFRVELVAPDGSLWVWGPEEAAQRVTGSAQDFCRLVTQRAHRDDTDLVAEGADAGLWLDIAQAFAGPPGEGRKPA